MKETALTEHGEVEYTTVTCDSCNEDVVKTSALRFAIGNPKWDGLDYTFYETESSIGWVCPHCRDEPIGYPSESESESTSASDAEALFWFCVFGGIIVLALIGALTVIDLFTTIL
jgi:hypothetical protein